MLGTGLVLVHLSALKLSPVYNQDFTF